MIVLDTNAVLRFLLQDNSEMADLVENQMLQNEYLIPVEVVSEAVYVLDRVYKVDRNAVQRLFHVILCDANSNIPYRKVVEKAIADLQRDEIRFRRLPHDLLRGR